MSGLTTAPRRPSAPVVLLVAAATASATLLLILTSHLTFFLDDWDLLLHRRGFSADAILRPHNEHIVIAPALIYKALQATFGMDSAGPFQLVGIATFILSAVLLFVWLRSRVGEWPALFGAVAILFLGSAWEDLLSPFQIGFFGSMACGLGALLALERETRRTDLLACGLLTGSAAFSSLGLPFLAGAAVAVLTGREPLRRLWIVAVPALLFALWWLGWGRDAETAISFQSVANAPRYVLDGVSASIASLLGLAPPDSSPPVESPDWGRPLLVLAIGAVAWRIHRLGAIPRWAWVAGAITAGFWLLTGINSALFRSPTTPRYMYIGAILCLMIAAALLRGVRLGRAALIGLGAVAVAAVAGNLVYLGDGYDIFRSTTDRERGGITALELARDTVDPGFLLTEENSDAPYFDYVDAASYLSAVDAFGSPGLSEQELRDAPEATRVAADKALVAALPVGLVDSPRGVRTAGPPPTGLFGGEAPVADQPACVAVAPTEFGVTAVSLPPGGALLRAGSQEDVRIRARRFSTESFPVGLGTLAAGRSGLVEIPADRAGEPWELQLFTSEPVTVCGGAAPASDDG